jgi:hypothetical protein
MWFGIDDSSTSVHFPVYGSVTRIPAGWAGLGPQDGATPPMMTFSLDSAFYVFNLVANWAYTRWEVLNVATALVFCMMSNSFIVVCALDVCGLVVTS